jgi:aminopeptidase N
MVNMIRFIFFVLLFLVPAMSLAADQSSGMMTEYKLDVTFDIPASKIMGTATIHPPAGKTVTLHTGALKIIDIKSGQNKVEPGIHEGVLNLHAPEDGAIVIRYEGVFREEQYNDTNYGVVGNAIGEEGISLTGLWYPSIDELCLYHLSAELPDGFTAVSEAEEIRKSVSNGKANFIFDFPHPSGGMTFAASKRYEEIRDNVDGIDLYAYFFPEDRHLADTYIKFAKKYFRLYEEMLGKYAYKRFSIVENFLPTGYSMPTFTLLGRDVVRLPFIVETSLGHEILHQWFGNLVYVDYDKGNWSEGLTVYLADHLYEEQKGKGWEYRKQTLIDYESYVNEKNEFPLKNFAGRIDFPSRAIGYGKGAMVFHMLRREVGDDAFNRALREFVREKRFQRASWDDIKRIIEKNSGKELEWFFRQWVEEPGIPDLYAGEFDVKENGVNFDAAFTVGQKGKTYKLELPLTVSYLDGSEEHLTVQVDKAVNPLTISVRGLPEKIVIDDRYDVFRRPAGKEFTPVVAGLIGAEKPVIVTPAGQNDKYDAVIDTFRKRGGVEKKPSEIKEAEMKSSAVLILGNDNPVSESLFGNIKTDAGFSVTVKKNPWDPYKVICVIDGRSRQEVDQAFGKIFHYGKYGELLFDGGKNIVKKADQTERGMNVDQKDHTVAVDVSAMIRPRDVLAHASGKRIIYIGEFHDRFSNHAMELEFIKTLYKRNKKIAIGMEMFERSFQKILDDFIAGTIDEKAMLRETEYFKRWSFDYNLYRPILTFARQEKIPVVALNMRREIVDKVARGGFDSLSEIERKEIPPQMDRSDEEYRERLRSIFEKHAGFKDKNFDFFCESQILWDETMSQSIDDYLKRHNDFRKDGQFVVIAGSGHLAFGSGIPKRTFRRNGLDYAIVLNDMEMEKDVADYLIYPGPVEGTSTPRIMAMLDDSGGKITVIGFPEGSVSEKAGMKKGDRILSLDETAVATVDDMRIYLLYKKKGDTLKVKVRRKLFLLGETDKTFSVVLE